MKRSKLRERAERLWRNFRAHGGEIAYYAAVAAALTAIAFAAERYRGGQIRGEDAPSLPAAELSASPEGGEGEAESGVVLPEGARLLRGYSEAPAWNAALGQWESHPATDYQLPAGEATCLLAGTVRSVERGGALGGCVEVESGEAVLRYGCIEPRAFLLPGEALEAGEIVGELRDRLPGEADFGPHLHLELILNGQSADFAAWAEASQSGD